MPELCELITENFGDCIRTAKIHAKFCTIKNENWNIVLRTSMNLNSNPRIENFEISDDLRFFEFFNEFVQQCFLKLPSINLKTKKGNYGILPGLPLSILIYPLSSFPLKSVLIHIIFIVIRNFLII
jgi:hypothetical protein